MPQREIGLPCFVVKQDYKTIHPTMAEGKTTFCSVCPPLQRDRLFLYLTEYLTVILKHLTCTQINKRIPHISKEF
jgi:hypothetical protein